ncbi:alpha helix protein [Klebsiella pneumoniae]|nr:alpha helix protein [Klebsiella pneumoniae]
MTKQPEDWLDDVPGDDVEDEDDEIIWVSKSEIKRDAEELKRLGAELVDLGKNALDKIPLDTDLRDAIELAQRIKKEGRRRQLAPPLPQKEMPKVAFSAFIMSPSFMSAATPGTTTARAPAFSAPAATFWPLPRRSPMTTVICSMFCSLQVIFRDFEVDGEQPGLFIRQVAELCDHFAGQHH